MSSANARSALAWAGGVQVIRDVAQFAAMLVLVRLLSPEQYGAMALAQAVMGIATLIAAGAFISHALQVRDPDTIDWQSHFTAGTLWNAGIGVALLAGATFLATPIWGADVGLSLALLALAPLLGGPAEVRNSMLCAHHDWTRFRLLSLAGTFLGLGFGIGLGFGGFGVVALAVQPALFVLPAAIDLFWSGFRPTWRFDRTYYRDVISFGLNRFAAGSLGAARGFAEQTLIAANFSLAVNGVYSRSVGLSSLLVFRFGAGAVGALYPILTRAESGSPEFRRSAARVLQGVAWTAIPAAAFLATEAEAIVALLYGDGWVDVAYLLPAASAFSATGALHFTVSRLLLANESRRASLVIEVGSGLVSIGLTFFLLPQGLEAYLWALVGVGAVVCVCGAVLLSRVDAIDFSGAAVAVAPPLLASALAALSVYAVGPIFEALWLPAEVGVLAACFGFVYAGVLLAAFNRPTLELLTIVPGIARIGTKKRDPIA